MKAISPAQSSQVISLLQDGYSCHQIEQRTGLGKSTVQRISKEFNVDKENHKGGHPSKLSTYDQVSIIRQFTTGKLDNAVQAAKFINSTITTPVTPQTVRNMLKDNNFRSVTKVKCPLLISRYRKDHLKWANAHKDWTVED